MWDAIADGEEVWTSPRWQDTSDERRVSTCPTCSEEPDASSPPSSKRDAVELVRTGGRPIAEIARELGIYDSTLGNWVRQDRIDRGEQEGLSSDQQARLGELERETTRLRMERDLLKRTVAFWVKEQSTP
jgi:transposase